MAFNGYIFKRWGSDALTIRDAAAERHEFIAGEEPIVEIDAGKGKLTILENPGQRQRRRLQNRAR